MAIDAAKKTVLAACLLFATSIASNALAATYYVATTGNDANAGSSGSPWKTIGKAATSMVAGDTTIVSAGSYGEKVDTVRSGSEGNQITFRASGRVVTKTFNIGHPYITIDGFEMTAASDGYMMTITGSFCRVLNNTIHDTGATWGVIRINGSSITGCVFSGNKYYDSIGASDDLPVFIVDGSNHLFENNEIGPAKDIDAFRVWGYGIVIRGNYIHDITRTNPTPHMDVIQTFGGGRSELLFENNLVKNLPGQIIMTENNGNPGPYNWVLRNNVYVHVEQQASVGIPNVKFYNNTFYDCGSDTGLIMYLYDASGKSNFNNTEIRNNLFVPSSKISSYSQVMSIGSSGSGVVTSNNYITRIGTWGTVSGFSDSGGINGGDPKFQDASSLNFHLLSGSPAIDKAMPIAGLTTDYDGVTRSTGSSPDIGAFEYVMSGGKVPNPPSNITLQ